MGIMVAAALEAAGRLEQAGVNCRVLNMPTLKPIDEEAIVLAAAETGSIVTAEEHLEHGGLGSTVARVLTGHPHIAGFTYTQLTDIEQEQNGIYTYDRRAKFDAGRLRRAFGAPAAMEQK